MKIKLKAALIKNILLDCENKSCQGLPVDKGWLQCFILNLVLVFSNLVPNCSITFSMTGDRQMYHLSCENREAFS